MHSFYNEIEFGYANNYIEKRIGSENMRFRKTVKICKGVRVNFSKSGVSTTIGGRGLSVNVGRKGTYLNTGIPGTGLYDRTRFGGSSATHRTNPSTQTISQTINLKLADDGVITFYDERNNMITDPTMIRRIKSTPAFKAERERMMRVRFEEINGENEKFINMHKLAPEVCREEMYINKLKSLKLKKYVKNPYTIHKPTEERIKALLEQEATEKIKTWKFWTITKERRAYVEKNFEMRFIHAVEKWNEEKENFDNQQETVAQNQNEKYLQEYNKAKEDIEKAIEGEPEYIETKIESWLASVTLPVEFDMQYDYSDGVLYLDLDLPEIEDLPADKATMLANGTTKRKNKTQKELKEDYVNCVFGLALFFSAHLFNISPRISEIVISGYTQRSSTKAMDPQDEYIYSIKFIREKIEDKQLASITAPLSFCLEFENRCNLTSTLMLKKIEPFEKR